MASKSRFADGSIAGQRMLSASVRAMDAHLALRRKADRVSEEMDDITNPHGIPTTELSAEDSLVIVVDDARGALAAK